ncbi:hypothetical protein DPX16_5733 [Anabarilius grahami]|uniref:Uncharacterized protein n=1 Tax=Anabarilius grahami TaxID=495550 RepID=A0A3N0ZA11_ANAGA|nr:hypothetical protein DPX16_5733 [Anabarilius grahami]
MAEHTSPLESGQLLSPDIPMLTSPPPPQHPPNIVNGDVPQQTRSGVTPKVSASALVALGIICVTDPDPALRRVIVGVKATERSCPSVAGPWGCHGESFYVIFKHFGFMCTRLFEAAVRLTLRAKTLSRVEWATLQEVCAG